MAEHNYFVYTSSHRISFSVVVSMGALQKPEAWKADTPEPLHVRDSARIDGNMQDRTFANLADNKWGAKCDALAVFLTNIGRRGTFGQEAGNHEHHPGASLS
jgi:hypothetical protein